MNRRNHQRPGTSFAEPLWCVLVLALLLGAQTARALPEDSEPLFEPPVFAPLAPMDVHPRTSLNVLEQLSRHHYVRRRVDDDLSSDVLDRYLELLDPQRSYFLSAEVAAFERYRYALDDAMRSADLDPAFEIFNLYQERLLDRLSFTVELLEAGLDTMDLEADESLQLDRSEAEWLDTPEALDDLWRRRLKATVVAMLLNDKELDEVEDLLLKRYRNRLHRAGQNNSEDAFQLYMNAVATAYDPHTQYFSPRTSENFNINMSLSLEGIGAVLRTEDEYTSVVRLVPAGPADKSELLHPSDRIIAVSQGDSGDWVDVVGWRLDDVVDLIRGPAGSTVQLEIIPRSEEAGTTERISIVREAVKLEEQSAQSRVIEVERNGVTHRLGVIEIPQFYIDFQAQNEGDPDYKSTTRDVRALIEELRAQDVEGLIIDLRNNGGGSLIEANKLTGLFINAGPTVQIRNASGRVELINDDDGSTTWDGPLAVLVNRLSASASEIFAGAIQDYQRGLVIGGQTFGKGTVQTLIPLNRGQLKMTQAKFYRVSGQSTQHQGVIPDIEYPEIYDPEEIGESTLDDALPWDVIRPTRFRRAESFAPLLSMLTSRHASRTESNPEFVYLNEILEYNRERASRTHISLQESARRTQQDEFEAERLAIENRRRVALGDAPVASLEELDALENDEVAEDAAADATAETTDSEPADEGGHVTVVGSIEALDHAQEIVDLDETVNEDGAATEDATSDADATAAVDEEEEEPDALLVEGGQILLDYITLVRSVATLNEPVTGETEAAAIP